MSTTLPRTLFVGRGKSAIVWYRCALPAMALGQDWIGIAGEPGAMTAVTGLTRAGGLRVPDFTDYEVVVVQLAGGPEWLQAIRAWQAAGVTVLYEIDDWLRGIRKLGHHDFKDAWSRDQVEAFEMCMRAADGIICSTEWLAGRYRAVNPVTYVCRNGIDLKRYALTRPRRDQVAIGWAGGTGHRDSALPWVREVGAVMRAHEATRFISVGQPFADWLADDLGPARCLSVPFSPFDTYPAAMTLFDVALAPAGAGAFFKGKSDLRWLEASALGIPLIADPVVYPEIEDGVTGFHASAPDEMRVVLERLVTDAGLRERVGAAARAYVAEHRTAEVAAGAWAGVIREAVAARAAAA